MSQRPRRKGPLVSNTWRHPAENFCCMVKKFKRIAVRGDKTNTICATVIPLAATLINSR